MILADVVAPDRQGLIIGRVVVGAEQAHAPALQALDQAVQRALVAAAALPIDQPARPALEGLPDPEFSGLFLTKCQTSSISTTAVPPRAGSAWGSGLARDPGPSAASPPSRSSRCRPRLHGPDNITPKGSRIWPYRSPQNCRVSSRPIYAADPIYARSSITRSRFRSDSISRSKSATRA